MDWKSSAPEPRRGSMTKPRVSAQRATLGTRRQPSPNPNGVLYLLPIGPPVQPRTYFSSDSTSDFFNGRRK